MSDLDAVVKAMAVIRNYLDLHPEAADTVIGVRCWLKLFGQNNETLDVVQCALDKLVARGELTCEPLPGGNVLYRLHKSI